MRIPNLTESAFSSARLTAALLLCIGGFSLGAFTLTAKTDSEKAQPDATPASGTLTDTSGPITYTSGPFLISNPSGTATLDCVNLPCDDFGLTVNVPASFANTHNVVITVSWPNPAEDYDIYLRSGLPPGTASIRDSASSSNPEVIVVDAQSGQYTIRTVPFAVAGGVTTTTVELRVKPVNPTPPPLGTGTPRYHNFPAPTGMGNNSGEPTLAAGRAIPGQPGGRTMYISGTDTLRVTWNDCSSPASAPGFPANPALTSPLWEDKTYVTTGVTTLDPILFGDLATGRIQVSQLGPKTSFLAYTDNEGGEDPDTTNDYTPTQGSPINPGVDHQTIGGGPYSPTLEPPHPVHPNALYYASQDLAIAQLGRSDTGGLTYGPAVPMYNLTQCGGLHGHIKVTPRSPLSEANGHIGTVYVPNKGCAGQQAVVVSEDNGVTFAIRPVAGSIAGPSDPSVGIDKAGKIYVAMADGTGRAMVSVSADKGVTWQTATPIDVGLPFGIKNTVFPTAVGGDSGRATVMFLATDTGGNYQATGVFTGIWHIYAASTFDGGLSWSTVRVTPENDPVQRGSICTGGTTCGGDRNLLDFNDMEIDQEGRVIMAFADGCVGCTSPTGADSRSEKATIARQSGGKRMLAAFDPPQEPIAPAAPLVTSVARTGPSTVLIKWSIPDNGGAPITGFNVYRKTGATGAYSRLGSSPTTDATRTTYTDATATDESVQYFYRVTAVNAQGEGASCGDFLVGTPAVTITPCALPGINVVTDAAGDNTDAPNAQRDLRSVSMAELFDPVSSANKLFITLKVGDLNPLPQPSSRWTVFFTRGSTEWFVAMVTDDTASPGTPVYRYGHTTVGPGGVRQLTTDGQADAGSQTIDGKILITISTPTRVGTGLVFPPFVTGETLTNVNAITQQSGGVLLLTVDSTGNGTYTIAGNASCAPNALPIAALAASPLTGIAPVTVNFDATMSSDPDTGDSVASYTFNFGDGSPEVTQATPTISHVYRDSGNFRATLRVTDSRGATSTNAASTVIQVNSTLNGLASRKTHGAAGPFDINLLTNDGSTGIECRNTGNNSHTIVYTFQRNLTAVTSSTVVEGAATKGAEGIGPAPNQYSVQLTGANAQYVTLELNGVQDSAGTNLTGVKGRIGLLTGDTTANLAVNASDVNQARSQSGQVTDQANFRTDVNASGVVNASDVSLIKANSGSGLSATAGETSAKTSK